MLFLKCKLEEKQKNLGQEVQKWQLPLPQQLIKKLLILADAEKQSEIMKGEGDGQRNKIFIDAFGRDPEFFAF